MVCFACSSVGMSGVFLFFFFLSYGAPPIFTLFPPPALFVFFFFFFFVFFLWVVVGGGGGGIHRHMLIILLWITFVGLCVGMGGGYNTTPGDYFALGFFWWGNGRANVWNSGHPPKPLIPSPAEKKKKK